MIDGPLTYLVVATAVGCGLMGGAFFAFSGFVMAGLKRLPLEQGMAAMQEINVTAVTPPFMIAFFGTALGCVAAAVWTVVDWHDPASIWLLIGAALYLVGIFLMTAAFHVPRNDRLASADPAADGSAELWIWYLRVWTRGNHVRTGAGLAAAAALTIGVIV